MKFYINLGKNKNKGDHLRKFGSNIKLEFSIVVIQKDKNGNKEYAYLPAETWNKDLIAELVEDKMFELDKFYFRFYKDKYKNIKWVMVVQSLKGKEEQNNTLKQEQSNTLTNDIDFDISKELGDLF